MRSRLKFTKQFELSDLPGEWKVARLALDWLGQPLLLADEGKPDRYKPPKARHLIYWEAGLQCTVTLAEQVRLFSYFIQRLGDGWLLTDGRGGRADVCDKSGRARNTLDLGDAINDVQTTSNGYIWTSYFDEGVYGQGIGQNGLVCFDAQGQPIFRFAEFAEQNQLPFIDDCYAINAVDEKEIWLPFYSAFPLIALGNFKLHKVWSDFGCIADAFALQGESAIFPRCYEKREGQCQLLRRSLSKPDEEQVLHAVDEEGRPITGPFEVAARGPNLYLLTGTTLYRLQIDP